MRNKNLGRINVLGVLMLVTKSFWQENEFFSSYYETSEKPRGIAEWFWSMLSNKREEKEFDVVKK